MNDVSNPAPLLARLGIAAGNPGACLGPDRWRGGGAEIASDNPATGRAIARVQLADESDVDAVLAAAAASSARTVARGACAAARRGRARFGSRLREHKDASAGWSAGERQDPVRGPRRSAGDETHLDFAVGLSRPCSTADDRIRTSYPSHDPAMDPLGVVALLPAFNFPVAAWA